MQEVRLLQLRRSICFFFSVDQKRKGDAGLFPERLRVVHVSQTDSGEVRSLAAEFLLVCAQLRDVLAAEDSTIVPQKDDHRGTVSPEISQPPAFAVGIRQRDISPAAAER